MIRRFFQDYKILEGKAVEVDDLTEAKTSFPVILEALERYSLSRRRGFR
jgi:inorganic pyrophosphatase